MRSIKVLWQEYDARIEKKCKCKWDLKFLLKIFYIILFKRSKVKIQLIHQ